VTYRIFGLLLDCDVPLPELPRARRRSPDITVRLGAPPRVPRDWAWIDRWDREDGVPWLRIGRRDDRWLLRFPGLADFVVTVQDGAVACRARTGVPARTIRHLLLDQVVPLALSTRGYVLLHASAVLTPQGALLFAGPSGSGKSTLAFGLAEAGCPLLSDDVVRIDVNGPERPVMATPAYPGARLWPDVLDAFRVGARGRRLAHYSPKRRVPPRTIRADRRLPVARVYLLETAPALEVREVPARDALVALLKQTYRMDVSNQAEEHRHFDTLASLCAAVPIRELAYPRAFDSLDEVVRTVMADRRAGTLEPEADS
jgi:hypothetical protein